MKYLDQATLDEAREALRNGRTIVELAAKLDIDADLLSRLLGTPERPKQPEKETTETT